jgi:hypothetical protein
MDRDLHGSGPEPYPPRVPAPGRSRSSFRRSRAPGKHEETGPFAASPPGTGGGSSARRAGAAGPRQELPCPEDQRPSAPRWICPRVRVASSPRAAAKCPAPASARSTTREAGGISAHAAAAGLRRPPSWEEPVQRVAAPPAATPQRGARPSSIDGVATTTNSSAAARVQCRSIARPDLDSVHLNVPEGLSRNGTPRRCPCRAMGEVELRGDTGSEAVTRSLSGSTPPPALASERHRRPSSAHNRSPRRSTFPIIMPVAPPKNVAAAK